MKNLILSFLFFAATVCVAQAPLKAKPDLASLTTTEDVSLTLKGLTVEKTITQEELIPIKNIELKGENAAKYKLIYYHFKTNYMHTYSQNDEMFDNVITEPMTRFFTDLEKNCKLTFDDVVVQNTETGKQFKIASLSVVVKTDKQVIK